MRIRIAREEGVRKGEGEKEARRDVCEIILGWLRSLSFESEKDRRRSELSSAMSLRAAKGRNQLVSPSVESPSHDESTLTFASLQQDLTLHHPRPPRLQFRPATPASRSPYPLLFRNSVPKRPHLCTPAAS
ncbi:hypothetical protein BCR35DRAFT_121701 [Leucosporidium creatinivorum]|uniref:Uncharacterized protein n=1 Tax=Leucosporidium creatinivorum TaxID=106004 RepID=A0A1Y2EXA9_9BASI|nr:hypothetical protein BCR35DRAFT_121701 [Leucosporidium creatinivorum]